MLQTTPKKKILVVMTILLALIAIGGIGFGFKNKIIAFCGPHPPPWPPDLDPVLVYNADFAHRFGLDPSKATSLDPGILAIAMTFEKHYEYKVDPRYDETPDQFSHKGTGDQLTPDEAMTLNNHAAILPIFFPGRYDSYTLGESYNYRDYCAINLYLDNHNPQIQQIDFRPASVFIFDRMHSTLIYDLWHGYGYLDESKVENGEITLNVNTLKMNRLHLALYGMGSLKNLQEGDYWEPADQNHYVNFLPGITFVSFQIDCGLPKKYPQGILVWFEKKGGTNYFHQQDSNVDPDYGNVDDSVKINLDDFVVLHIPAEITHSANAQSAVKSIEKSPY